MRHRISQQLATGGGMVSGSPLAMATNGYVAPQNRFRYVKTEKRGVAGALDYRMTVEVTVDARNAENVEGEYIDDLALDLLTVTA